MAIYKSGVIINNRYEVVQGPREKPTLVGGMGLVYLCVDHGEGGHPVALKTFRPEYLPNREARDRFLREGSTWVQLGNHPHIVRCNQVIKGAVGSEVFFVLELIAEAEGKRDASLRSWLIPGKPLPVEQALLFSLHLARGMKHATEKIPGLVHRDLKPENVLVGRDGMARITDFGLASAAQVASGELLGRLKAGGQVEEDKENEKISPGRTQLTRGVVGTPLYMAPEQWAGAELDARSDIYAYGCILYEMLAGERAVADNTVAEIEKAHRESRVAEISSRLPDHLRQLLQQCVKVNREERYGGWLELESEVVGVWKAVMGKEAPTAPDSSPDLPAERVAAGWSYNAMGVSYFDIGKFSVARDYFEKALAIGRQEGERFLQAAALGDLGNAYAKLGETRNAIGYHEQHLAIAREIGDRQGEGNALSSLGNAHADLGDARGAIKYYEQHLDITREIGDYHGEGQVRTNLGSAFLQLGDARRAIGYYDQSLAIAREIGDRQGEGRALGSLGSAYRQLGDVRGAIGYFEQRLAIALEIGDRYGEGWALGNLGYCYSDLGDVRGAIGYNEKYLAITREIGDRQGQGNALGGLGTAYLQLGDVRTAIVYYEQDLSISREIGDRYGEGQALGNLGAAYWQLGDACKAIAYYEQDLAIVREIGDLMGEVFTNFNLALLFVEQGQPGKALGYAEYALQVVTRIGHAQKIKEAQQLVAHIKAQVR